MANRRFVERPPFSGFELKNQNAIAPHDQANRKKTGPITLAFSEKYDSAHSKQYYEMHQATLARRLSHWRESRIAKRALEQVASSNTVLDLPCGAGRFWPLLAEREDRVILAADNSAEMIKVALQHQPSGRFRSRKNVSDFRFRY